MVAAGPDARRSISSTSKPDLRQSLWSIAVLAAAGLAIALVSIGVLYKVSVHQQGLRLLGMVRGQARIIEAMAAHEMNRSVTDTVPDSQSDAFDAVMSQLRAAQDKLASLGQTGELYVARREGDSIVYLLAHRGQSLIHPARMVFGRERGEPMYRALTGRSGAGVLHDYRGTPVLAAYEPVKVFGLGMVAALDVSEVRAPFLKADLIVLAATLLFVIGGGLLLLFVTAPGRRRLRASEEFTRRILAASPDSIKVLDLDGRLLYMNEGGRRVMEIDDLSTVLDTSWTDLWQGRDREAALEAIAAAKAGGTGTFEGCRPSNKGTPKVWDVVVTALVGPDGRAERLLAASRDITERKRAESELTKYRDHLEELVRARTAALELANKDLEAFSYSVSHDLRAPLRAINGFAQALREDCAAQLDSTGHDYLDRMRAASRHMAELIDDLINLARVARLPVERKPVDLTGLARTIAGELREAEPARQVELVIPDGMTAQADPVLAEMVLRNLLNNAWKFTGKHPTARIEVGETVRDGEPVWFVRDDGAGFDMTYVGNLSKPFQRLHGPADFPGTGIGLVTVQRIVLRHGGRWWIEGAVEKGATFYFTFQTTTKET